MKASPHYRVTIGGIGLVVLVCSLLLAGLVQHSDTWASIIHLLYGTLLALSLVGAICVPKERRAPWLGFAAFGIAHSVFTVRPFPEKYLSDWVTYLIHVSTGMARVEMPSLFAGDREISEIVSYSCGLIFASVGAVVSQFVFSGFRGEPITQSANVHPARRAWTARRILGALAEYLAFAYVALLATRWWPSPASTLVIYTTWGVLLLIAIAAAFGRGRPRALYLGAMLFGTVYLMSVTLHLPSYWQGWPRPATHLMLNAIRPWIPGATPPSYPAPSSETVAAHERIRSILNRPVTIAFDNPITLQEFFKQVDKVFIEVDGKDAGIQIEPVALQEAEATLESPIRVSCVDRELRKVLRTVLRQLGMVYHIEGGAIVVEAASSDHRILEPLDSLVAPYFQIGQCFLAICAAVIGAFLGPMVYDRVAE